MLCLNIIQSVILVLFLFIIHSWIVQNSESFILTRLGISKNSFLFCISCRVDRSWLRLPRQEAIGFSKRANMRKPLLVTQKPLRSALQTSKQICQHSIKIEQLLMRIRFWLFFFKVCRADLQTSVYLCVVNVISVLNWLKGVVTINFANM